MAEQKDLQAGDSREWKERQSAAKDSVNLAESCQQLAKYGGFDLVETAIDGVQNMNPEKKARRKIFLSDADKAADREALKRTLKLWATTIAGSENVAGMIEKAEEQSKSAEFLLRSNLLSALEESRDLERSYRTVALFYKNTESDKLKNVSIMNAAPDQLRDLDNSRFIDTVAEELKQNYDRLDLRKNYSILCLPGYLGSNKVLEKWAKIAYGNKVMLVTDFEHLDEADDVAELFEEANLTGGDVYRSNVMMTCNWLVGRGKAIQAGEEEDLFVPPSGALAGKMYKTLMSQVTAGKKHGE